MTDSKQDTATERPTEPKTEDLRGQQTTRYDRSAHRSHAWLYEDLLA